MQETRKELLKRLKEKAPDIYEEVVSESDKELLKDKKCSSHGNCGEHHGNCGEHHHGNCGDGEKQWGGHRCGAGRPKSFCNRKAITKHIPEETINKIKDYAKSNNISENEALDRLINAGYKSFNVG